MVFEKPKLQTKLVFVILRGGMTRPKSRPELIEGSASSRVHSDEGPIVQR